MMKGKTNNSTSMVVTTIWPFTRSSIVGIIWNKKSFPSTICTSLQSTLSSLSLLYSCLFVAVSMMIVAMIFFNRPVETFSTPTIIPRSRQVYHPSILIARTIVTPTRTFLPLPSSSSSSPSPSESGTPLPSSLSFQWVEPMSPGEYHQNYFNMYQDSQDHLGKGRVDSNKHTPKPVVVKNAIPQKERQQWWNHIRTRSSKEVVQVEYCDNDHEERRHRPGKMTMMTMMNTKTITTIVQKC